jgi:hypothetical protein
MKVLDHGKRQLNVNNNSQLTLPNIKRSFECSVDILPNYKQKVNKIVNNHKKFKGSIEERMDPLGSVTAGSTRARV